MIQDLPKIGVKRLHVVCPGFISDCLETLEEIAEAKDDFLDCGGVEFKYIPCLNDGEYGIEMLSSILCKVLEGWPTSMETDNLIEEKKIQSQIAREKGATN